jgi:diguanylate cyclase (GGDEF)-like protein
LTLVIGGRRREDVRVAGDPKVGIEGTLHELMVAAGSLLDPSALAKVAVAEVRRVLGVDGASLAFWDADQQLLVPLAFDDPEVTGPDPVFHPGQGLIGEAFAREAPVIVADYRTELAHPAAWANVVSGLGVPLHADGRLLGALSAQTYYRREFTASDVELLEFVAEQVGPALGAMRTLARAQRQAAEANALATLMRQGAGLDNREELFLLVSHTAVRLLGADVVGVLLGDGQRRDVAWRGVVGNRTEAWLDPRYSQTHPNAVRIFNADTLIHRPGQGPLDPDRYPFFAAEEVSVAVSVPLDPTDGMRGALCLGWRFDVQLSPASLRLVEALAGFAGTLVASATSRAERDAIIAGAPVMIVALRPDGVVTMCEGATAAVIGVGPEAVGHHISELFPDEPLVQEALKTVTAGGVCGTIQVDVGANTLDVVIELRDNGMFLIGTDVTERAQAERELVRRAIQDELTGLPNGPECARRIAEVLKSQEVCAVVADIRSFDFVNEAIGYEAGDQLLRKLGGRLDADLADAIVVGRIGGDEFAVATAGVASETLVKRVRASLEAFVAGGTEDAIAVDVRCGLASALAGGDADVLLRHADSALQVARRGTRAVVMWDAEEAERRKPQHTVTQQLRRALDAKAFTLAYQPIIDVRDGSIRRVEALARWPTGIGTPVAPDVFVPLAERLGRIGQLTNHVLDVALRDVAAQYGVPVSVNISPLDVMHGDLPDFVVKRLSAHGLEPSMLMLELTEHAALEAGDTGLEELAALGVALSIDDFGRGWSSLEMLKRLPALDLKLDRSYVSRASENATDEAIVRAAVTVGHALGMQVVAEGVEDEVVLDAVARFGCDLAQGYHIARPMDCDAFGDWLKRHRAQTAGTPVVPAAEA